MEVAARKEHRNIKIMDLEGYIKRMVCPDGTIIVDRTWLRRITKSPNK